MLHIQLYLTMHSYGQYILVPYGYDVVYPPDYNDMLALANKAAAKFVKYKYTVGNSAALLYAAAGILSKLCSNVCTTYTKHFPCIGGSDDWAKSIGIKYSYTFELSDTGQYGFALPPSEILPVCKDFFPALNVFAAQVATANATTTAKPVTTTTRATTTTKRVTTITTRATTTTKPNPTTTKCSCVCP